MINDDNFVPSLSKVEAQRVQQAALQGSDYIKTRACAAKFYFLSTDTRSNGDGRRGEIFAKREESSTSCILAMGL